MDLLTVLPGQDHLAHRTLCAYLLDGDRENIGSMETVKALPRPEAPEQKTDQYPGQK